MPVISLFDPKSPFKAGGLVLDAILSEDHSLENKVTEFPIETGAVINDHIVNAPRRFTIQGFVSDWPVRSPGAPPGNYARLAFQELESLYESRALVTVLTSVKQYDNMAIEKVAIPRSAATGQALEFTIDLIEVKQADSQTVTFQSKSTASPSAQPLNDRGKQTPADTGSKTAAQVTARAKAA